MEKGQFPIPGEPLKPPETKPFLPPSHESESEPCCISIHHEEDEDDRNFSANSKRKIESFEREIKSQNKEKGCRNYFGIMLALFAGAVFTSGTVLAKYMKQYHPFTLTVFRVQGVLFPSIFMVLYAVYVKKQPVFEPVWPLSDKGKRKTLFGVISRAAIGCTCLFLHFGALKYLQVADVAVVGSCKPIFVTIAAFIFLGETCGFFPVLMALLTMVGVGVITRPPILTGKEEFDQDTLIGAGFALSSILLDTIVVVIIRSLKRIHVSVMMLFLGIWASVQSIICAYAIGELKLPESGRDWALAGGMAAAAILNQAAMHVALQFEQANPVAVTRTMDFIFAFILQFVIMGIVPDLFSFSGAAIIISCVFLTVFRKWVSTRPKTNVYRKRFWFVLI